MKALSFAKASIRGMVILLFVVSTAAWGATGGTISGTVADKSGAVVSGATLTLVNTARQTTYQATSNKQGLYTFPNLPVGRYDLTVTATGFSPQYNPGLVIDTDSALRVDVVVDIGPQVATVDVMSDTRAQVDTTATHLGEVVSAAQMTSLPLNGRSYTDLLTIQPGVAPISTLLPSSVIMAGVTGGINPSGNLNPGNLSINGQRESSNGFLVNGIDVQEHMNGGTSIIPDLDSIEEFRVLTTNFDPEYGNYNGGIVTVITKAGTNALHGSVFEFFRNTDLDARGYFDPTRSTFSQNQFGGAIGGPVKRDRIFLFADYQGTRTTQGISTGHISVPTVAERNGIFNNLTGSVSGPYLASLLTQELGYAVTSGEVYTSVFPSGTIPQSAWSPPAKKLLQYIPSPNVGNNQYSTSAFSQTVRDDKGSARLDSNSRLGSLDAYYFVDDYSLDNPYPGSVAGASIPGFDALFIGRAQLLSLSQIKVINAKTVSELNLGALRYKNNIGQPHGGLGVSLASQGFTTGSSTSGIDVQAPQFEGVENITFPTFVMGVPITNLTQLNNTYYASEGVSISLGSHTLKFGGQLHFDQVNEHPNATFNGTFNINGTETGSPYADFLLGTPSNFTQSSGQPFYLRNRYFAVYAQDSWRMRNDLTMNIGLRWDLISPWWEKYNQLQTYIAGAQSTLYPGAPPGLVVAGDPGVPKTLASTSYKNFGPRLGLAYSPRSDHGIWNAIFGGSGRSSIRASFGLFYAAFPGLPAGIMYSVPPFGYNYLSPAPPLLATPFITAATGVNNGQRFPFPFPQHNVSQSSPDTAVNWSNFLPLSADPFFDHRNRVAYTDSYMVSMQRQFTAATLLTVSYVGNEGHHILTLVSANPGSASLCLSLPGCGPFGEDSTYTDASGHTIKGTRVGQDVGSLIGHTENYGENTADKSIANSNYNALETTLHYQIRGSQLIFSYTYAKSIDQGSSLGEQLDPIDPRHSRAISAWDIKHDFVISYHQELPFAALLQRNNRAIAGWSVSGTSRFASGFPVTLFDNSDNSLLGTLGNGANNYLLDTPKYLPGPVKINTNGRNGRPAFNTSLFPEEVLGQLGNAKRRSFYGAGIDNLDMTLEKNVRILNETLVEFRIEAFNVFNHAQFYGPAAVDGQRNDPSFGNIESAAFPRLVQVAAKIHF